MSVIKTFNISEADTRGNCLNLRMRFRLVSLELVAHCNSKHDVCFYVRVSRGDFN